MNTEQDPRRLIARLAVAVMIADGHITASELDAIDQFDDLGLGPFAPFTKEEIDRAMHIPPDVPAACKALASMGPDAAATIVAALAGIAASDGNVSPSELDVLSATGELLGLEPAETAYVLNSAMAMCVSDTPSTTNAAAQPGASPLGYSHPTEGERVRRDPGRAPDGPRAALDPRAAEMEQACRALGVNGEVSRAALNAAYLAQVERFNPAKVNALGPEFTVLAVRRLADATAAFETVLKSLNGRA